MMNYLEEIGYIFQCIKRLLRRCQCKLRFGCHVQGLFHTFFLLMTVLSLENLRRELLK